MISLQSSGRGFTHFRAHPLKIIVGRKWVNMDQTEFSQLVNSYRRYDNRALVIALAESYGRRDYAFSMVGRIRQALASLGLTSYYPERISVSDDTTLVSRGVKFGLELAIKFLLSDYEYENSRIQAIRNVMERRKFHMACYMSADFLVPDNWDLLEDTNPQIPPIDIEGVIK